VKGRRPLATHKAHATPTKDFFVRMITKDISLEDCILDLIDNCLDGARKLSRATTQQPTPDNYSGFTADVNFNVSQFEIVDNCGGITISEAIDYAFHFGRRLDAPTQGDYSIGLYGIGMKRAIFKMGDEIEIYSSTYTEAFRTNIDVREWLSRPPIVAEDGSTTEDWDFELNDAEVNAEGAGTSIVIKQLHPSISAQFANPEFANGLARIVARDYAQFLSKGFEIRINQRRITGFNFTVRESADFRPVRVSYEDESGVKVEIIAGMAGPPPDDLTPADYRAPDYYGWFVICNDRVIVAADKTDQTVWGDGDFPAWHYQYNGFLGVVSFSSKDPNLLPWTTTKRDVEGSNPTYRRAIERMKDATRSWIKYTNDRKSDLISAKEHEAKALAKPLFQVASRPTLKVPRVTPTSRLVALSTIQYQKPTSEVIKVKRLLGNSSMPNYQVGINTFDYFVKNESGD
jgi:hypothetical protein